MLPLDIAKTKIVELSTLKSGEFFFRKSNGEFQLGVFLIGNEQYCQWLKLTGPDAFTLARLPSREQAKVLRLIAAHNTLRLRIENTDSPKQYSDHQIGQLIFDSEVGACIAVRWPDMDPQHYKHVVAVDSWSPSQLESPSGGVLDNWAISIVDESGQWVDLISRNVSPNLPHKIG